MEDRLLQHLLKEIEKKNQAADTEIKKLKTVNSELIAKNINIEERLQAIENISTGGT